MFSILITSTVPKEKINDDRSVFYVLKEPCSKKMTEIPACVRSGSKLSGILGAD